MQSVPGSDRRHTQKEFSLRPGNDPQRKQGYDILFLPQTPTAIEVECALEMFSLFMLSICMHMKPSARFGLTILKQQETLLDELSLNLVSAGLVTDISEGLVYIVPAFVKFDLLV